METIKTFPGLAGFYVLTPEGQLGTYDPDGNFAVDGKLTKAFEDYNKQFLMSYFQNPAKGSFRLAIIHRTKEKRPWGSDTLLIEKSIVRRLYPMSGTTELDLTAFQRKNREKSIYRGMEIFLDYKDSSTPDMPVYCPVLFGRGTTLSDYATDLDRTLAPDDRGTPVVEVLNILASIPVGRRYTPEIGILKEKIYQGIIKKGMRKSAEFTLIENIRRNAERAKGLSSEDPYGSIDKRSERQVTLDSKTGAKAGQPGDDTALLKNISSSLVGHPEPADLAVLKKFARFRDMGHDKLELLANQCLVYKVPPGTQLLERGTNDTWNLYLVEGSVQLMATDGVPKIIEGETPAASNPVSFLKPRMYTVSAISRVAFLWIDDKLIEKILREKTPPRQLDGSA
ncbi:MAG: cyclic nucleotide-binding domain-containing protein [Gammaproteobacteria bacterium]|nr:cyclic nucleotide-binding domain-containing protein [Gammaproteobacteria bacterium]